VEGVREEYYKRIGEYLCFGLVKESRPKKAKNTIDLRVWETINLNNIKVLEGFNECSGLGLSYA